MFFKHHLKKKKATNVLVALISSGEPQIFQGGKHFYHCVQKLQSSILSAQLMVIGCER